MKSVQRHQLETNWLAKHLYTRIEKASPYTSTIAGVVIAVVLVILAWSWFRGSSAGHQNEAWDMYNSIVGMRLLTQESMTQLNRVSEEYQGTSMEPVAKVTWADGQVWAASIDILQDRAKANEALSRASSAYQSIIDSSSEADLVDRAHFGLARVYELRGDPAKARDEYLNVSGSYARLAKMRADELAKEKTKKTLEWLAKAEAPKIAAPLGSGTPGQRPVFDVQDFALPGAAGATTDVTNPAQTTPSIEEMFKDIKQLGIGEATDRYPAEPGKEGDTKSDAEKSATEGTPAATDSKGPAMGEPTKSESTPPAQPVAEKSDK